MWHKLSASVKTITQKSKSSFYYSFQILPPEKKAGIYSVYSFCRVTDDIVDSAEPVSVRSEKLLKWENDLQQALQYQKSENPVLDTLVKTTHEFDIPAEYFFELISGARMDLSGTDYKTFDDLYQYCYKVASVVGFMSVHIFGFKDDATLQYAEKLGIALQLTNIIRDVGKDIEMNRIYIPEEDLNRFSVTREDIRHKRYNENIRDLLAYQYKRALNFYEISAKLLPEEDRRNMLPSRIMYRTYFQLLKKIKNHSFNVFEEDIRIGEFRKKWIALAVVIRYYLGLL